MKNIFVVLAVVILPQFCFSQNSDSISKTSISDNKLDFLNSIYMSLDMRMSFRSYSLKGDNRDYRGTQFQNGFTALTIRSDINDKVTVNFRNRFNKSTDLQSLDLLGNNIELANIEVKATPDLNLQFGKQSAYFGGYQYRFSALDVLVYNDILNNALSYVTGVGGNYSFAEGQTFGFQVLNSRTILYADKYGDNMAENIKEPKWPVDFVGRWIGNFFDGKFQTRYSFSYSREVKDKGTKFLTLGHKYENKRLKLMYDFDYSEEQIDTKGVATEIIGTDRIAQKVTYIENWLRGEYKFSPEFSGLLTLMTSSASIKDFEDTGNDDRHLRTSYGVIPTIYYRPFDNIDLNFFVAYIGRFYNYSEYSKNQFNESDYNRNEVRFGFIVPLRVL